jgi:DNA-binding transcriptional LysR family regulator
MQNGQMFDWNDLKAFLAVARGGSTLAAAKALGVNQTTVARRIEALEAAVALKLFERGQSGSRLTEAGQALFPEAEAVERATEGFIHQALAQRRGMTGSLRVTINEALANIFLAPALGEFRRLYPDIKVEMLVGDAFLDLAKGEADVAIRGTGGDLPDSDLVSRKLSDIDWAIYCSRDYAIHHGAPTSPEEMDQHVLVGGEGMLAFLPAMMWMVDKASRAEIHTRSNSLTNLMVAVKAGLGVAPLPRLMAAQQPDLHCCMDLTGFPTAVFIVIRADMKDVPRVRAFIDFLTPHFNATRRLLEEKGRLNQALVAQEIQVARAALGEEV